jgi:hypothetical protein
LTGREDQGRKAGKSMGMTKSKKHLVLGHYVRL